jgi:4-alpha-methyl-delta7-sterol-4alpha-methyl oxidase
MMELSPQLRFALVVAVLHTGTLLAVWAITAAFMRRGWFERFRVAAGKAPDAALSRKAIGEVLGGQLLFPVLVYFTVYPLWTAMGGRFASWSAWWQVPVHLLVFILAEDTVFYFGHRALHVRWLFSHVHARHHRFRHVRTYVAEFAHPLENAMNFVAFFLGPILLGSPFAIVMVWMVIRTLETADAHSGYAFTSSASRHAFHHLHAQRGCYGSFFSPWDRLLGTDKQWRESQPKRTA